MAGQVALVCAPLGDLVAQARAGTITVLAASGKVRDPLATEVPTFIEQGFSLSGSGWYWKVGAYVQSNARKGEGSGSAGEVTVYKADISHSGGSGGSGSDDA